MQYHRDKEYMTHVGHLIQHPRFKKLADIPHHIHSNRLEHSIHVSYTSYKLAKNLVGMPVRLGVASCMTSFTMRLARDQVYEKSRLDPSPHCREKCTKDHRSQCQGEDIIIKHMWGLPCSASLQRILRSDHGG